MKNKTLGIVLVVVLIGFVPILNSNVTIDPNVSIQYIGLTILIIALRISKTIKQKTIINNTIIIPLSIFILYIVYSGLSVLISINKSDSIFYYSQLLLLFLLMLTLFQFQDYKLLFYSVSRINIVLCTIILVPAYYQLIHVLDNQLIIPESTYSINSLFPHRNLFLHFLLLILPFNMYSIFYENKIWRFLSLININLSLFLIIILSNRTSWAVLAVLVVLTILATLVKKLRFFTIEKKNKLILVNLCITIVLSALFLFKFSDTRSLKSHTVSTFDFTVGSTKDRTELWKRTYLLIKDKPFIGHGLESWKIHMLKYGNKGLVSENNTTYYQRPHNDFLWVSSEQGIIGLLMYLGFFIIILYFLLRLILCSKNIEYRSHLIVFLFVIVTYLIISFFSFPRERIGHCLVLFSSIGLFLNFCSNIKENQNCTTLNLGRIKLVVIIVLIPILVVGFIRYNSEYHTKNAISAYRKGDYHQCISEIEKAQSKVYQMDETSTPLAWYAGISKFRLHNYRAANRYLEQAIEINPYHIYSLNDYASSLSKLDKDYETIISYYKEAMYISPNYLDARLNLCALYYKSGEFNKAFNVLKNTETSNNERLRKTIVIIVRKLIALELEKKQENILFIELYKKEYNNFVFYEKIIELAQNDNITVNEIIQNPKELLKTLNK